VSDQPDESGKGSHRLRFGAGLLVGTILVAAVGHRLLTTSLGETARFGEDRRAVVSLRALTDVVARAGSGEAVRTVVAEFAKGQPQVAATRVVLFDGISLEASTDPADTGENAAPRRLKREEKDLYDRGQRLRASIETNRQEGGGRKDEVEKERLPDGSVSLAAPIEKDGEVAKVGEQPPMLIKRKALLEMERFPLIELDEGFLEVEQGQSKPPQGHGDVGRRSRQQVLPGGDSRAPEFTFGLDADSRQMAKGVLQHGSVDVRTATNRLKMAVVNLRPDRVRFRNMALLRPDESSS